MSDIMIDIETLSTKPNAVILTIGAIKFNRNEEIKDISKYETFYVKIARSSTTNYDVESSTLEWWLKQSPEIKFEAFESPVRIDLKNALEQLIIFIGEAQNNIIWSKSPDFDCVILNSAFCSCELKTPWKFYNTRCVRTVMDLANINLWDLKKSVLAHNALYDCYNQIDALSISLRKIEEIKQGGKETEQKKFVQIERPRLLKNLN